MAFLGLLGSTVFKAGYDAASRGDSFRAFVGMGIGSALVFLGALWPWIKLRVGQPLARTAAEVAGNFKWWTASVFLLLAYLAVPTFMQPAINSPPENAFGALGFPLVGRASPKPPPLSSARTVDVSREELKTMNNLELRDKAYELKSRIEALHILYIDLLIYSNNSGSDIVAKSKYQSDLDRQLSRVFKIKFLDTASNMYAAMVSRISLEPHFALERTLGDQGDITDGEIRNVGFSLQSIANKLR